MKIRAVNVAEIILFVLFVAATILTKEKIVRLSFIAIPAVLALGALYFPLGFYTIRSNKINTTYAVAYGILFSFSLMAIFFRILNADISVILLLLFIVIFLQLAIVEAIAISLFKQPNGKIIQQDPAFIVRYLVLFISMIVALITYFPLHQK